MARLAKMAAVMAVAAAGVACADWPGFMGAKGDGVAPETEKIISAFPAGGPKELWSTKLTGGFSSPAIANGKVYVLDRPGGGATEKFRVIDLVSGKEEWSVENESQPAKENFGTTRGTPAVDKDMGYTIGTTGDLIAVDLAAKKIVWKKNLAKDFGARPGGWGFAMSPVIHGKLLLVDTPGSGNSGLVALNKKTGEKVWASAAFGGADTYTTPVITTIEGVEQALCWHKGATAGVSTADGKVLWTYDWQLRSGRPIPNPVHMGAGRIFLTTGYGAGFAMLQVSKAGNAFSVKELAKDDRTGSKVSNPVLYKGHVYTNASDKLMAVQCIDAEGNIKWTSPKKFGMGQLIVADGKLVIMNGDTGTLTIAEASPAGYKELASAKVLSTKQVWAPLALSDGKLVVRDQETMKCLDIGAK